MCDTYLRLCDRHGLHKLSNFDERKNVRIDIVMLRIYATGNGTPFSVPFYKSNFVKCIAI